MKQKIKKTWRMIVPFILGTKKRNQYLSLDSLYAEIIDEVVSTIRKMSLIKEIEFDSIPNKNIFFAEVERIVKSIPKKSLLDYQKNKGLQISFAYSRVHLQKATDTFIISKIVFRKKKRSNTQIHYILRNNLLDKNTQEHLCL